MFHPVDRRKIETWLAVRWAAILTIITNTSSHNFWLCGWGIVGFSRPLQRMSPMGLLFVLDPLPLFVPCNRIIFQLIQIKFQPRLRSIFTLWETPLAAKSALFSLLLSSKYSVQWVVNSPLLFFLKKMIRLSLYIVSDNNWPLAKIRPYTEPIRLQIFDCRPGCLLIFANEEYFYSLRAYSLPWDD